MKQRMMTPARGCRRRVEWSPRTSYMTSAWVALVALTLVACTTRPGVASVSHAVLGTAEAFTVLGGSAVTNTGPTTVVGNLGVSPGTAITGFPPGSVTGGVIHSADAVALQAQTDVTTAYNLLAGLACDDDLTGQDLGGMTLTPGVYCFSSSAQLTGTLTLDAGGDPDALFVFQIGSTLTTASSSSVLVINGAQPCNVYWQIGSSATLGTTTSFVGNILALTSISLTTGAQVIGRALARNGAVTMDTNHLEVGPCTTPTDGGTPGDDDAGPGGGGDAGPGGGGSDGGPGGGSDGGPGGGSDGGPGGGSDGGADVCCVGVQCGVDCVDLSGDAANCGACGNVCAPGESCRGGACVGCSVVCEGACVELASDRNHCGACGNACAPGEYCNDSACHPCGFLCGGGCADLLYDRNNCGACGRVCPTDRACTRGVCEACPPGTALCDGTCREVATDESNCGSCGTVCGLGESCVDAACVCIGV
jgi:hypothetical protein